MELSLGKRRIREAGGQNEQNDMITGSTGFIAFGLSIPSILSILS